MAQSALVLAIVSFGSRVIATGLLIFPSDLNVQIGLSNAAEERDPSDIGLFAKFDNPAEALGEGGDDFCSGGHPMTVYSYFVVGGLYFSNHMHSLPLSPSRSRWVISASMKLLRASSVTVLYHRIRVRLSALKMSAKLFGLLIGHH